MSQTTPAAEATESEHHPLDLVYCGRRWTESGKLFVAICAAVENALMSAPRKTEG